jgi:Tol biopolymer transport system component
MLNPGAKLGPHEILSLVGAGGMGEVYKARDTRLDRIVAIKVLPAHLADKPELRERFEREARTIASLNHPHICTLHDIGQQDGIDFLVMEYLEGETLATRLLKGPLPLDQVLRYAIEIADALDKAHRKGVTHRDLKPGNIMLIKSGTKLLDFGLAKLKQAAVPGAIPISQMPTLSQNPTIEGTILGTLQYMAPEQVEGKVDEIDGRTDIFAFGAVVYEMATRKKAFEGKNPASVMAKILEVEPPAMSSIQPMTPPALDRVVQRCLAKEPDERWQTASDLTHELKWIAEGGSQAVRAGAMAAKAARLDWRQALMVGMAAVALLAVGGIATRILRPVPTAAPEMRTEIVTPSTTDPVSFALSPDGSQIVFVGSGDGPSGLWLRRLDATEAQPMAGTAGALFPFWSPDSRSVGFFADGRLKRVEIGGGSPQTLVSSAAARGGAWSPDGTILFTPDANSPLFRISASGGEAVAVTRLEKESSHRFPQFLPGGQQFLFYAQGTSETSGIYLGSLNSLEVKRLAATDTGGVYAPNRWVFFIRGGTLLAQQLDLRRGELTGDPVTMADSVGLHAALGVGAFSVSATGLVAYRPGGSAERQLVWFDRSGNQLGPMGPDANGLSVPSLSLDSRRVAAYRAVQGNADIWLLDATRSTRFTFDASLDRFPAWSPDGSQIVFDSNRKGRRDLYVKASSGAGTEELLLESAQDKIANHWSPDGRFVLYHSVDPQTSEDLWVLPTEGDRKPFVFLKTDFDERRGQFSPDGRWVAYRSNESGRYEIYVRPFNGTASGGTTGGQWQVSTSGGIDPRWRSDGKELYYIAPDGKLMAGPVTAYGATFEPGTPVVLFQTRIYGGGTDVNIGTQYDVSRNGRFLINTVLEDAALPITLLQNWAPGLQK